MFLNLYCVYGYMPVAGDTHAEDLLPLEALPLQLPLLLPSLVSLPTGKVVHYCRQIASAAVTPQTSTQSDFSFLFLSLCMGPM